MHQLFRLLFEIIRGFPHDSGNVLCAIPECSALMAYQISIESSQSGGITFILSNVVDSGKRVSVQYPESHIMVRIRNNSDAIAFREPVISHPRYDGTGPRPPILVFCVVIKPPVVGWVRSSLCLPWIEIYPSTNFKRLLAIAQASEIPAYISDKNLRPSGIGECYFGSTHDR